MVRSPLELLGSVQYSECFVFRLKQQKLKDRCSATGHVTLIIYWNSSLIAQEYFSVIKKYPMGAAIFVRYSKHSDLSFASVQQTFTANSRSVEQTEQTFNKTFAVFSHWTNPWKVSDVRRTYSDFSILRKFLLWVAYLNFHAILHTW